MKGNLSFKHYAEADYEAVCRFLIDLNREDRSHIHWNWARFEWMYEHPECDKSLLGSIGLWLDGARVVGAAIYDLYFGEAFCGALPEYAALYPEILDYAWGALRDEAGLGIAICEGNEAERAAAEAAGFARTDRSETVMAIGLDGIVPAPLPAGLHLTEPDPIRDGRALQWLFWRGFDHGEDRAEFERADSFLPRPRPHFNPRLGLAAADGTGELQACCILWYHPDTDYAYVEPVCTAPAWRGKGAAKALLTEALCRARALGAKKAYVISDQAFYRRLGFRTEFYFSFYQRAK